MAKTAVLRDPTFEVTRIRYLARNLLNRSPRASGSGVLDVFFHSSEDDKAVILVVETPEDAGKAIEFFRSYAYGVREEAGGGVRGVSLRIIRREILMCGVAK